uniref:ATP synthase complex subunit 8 n=1 Tax=Epixanthus frontalis TaxID=864873 RepID=A0A343S8P9_9EUCA|nr:ATP synthase F0 subunit 8 [Epixanthus frontalis]AUN45024.1 ATP synthase F0 subunit 8 [Epixanthus frontalis]
MPQMAPLLWLYLFFFFLTSLILVLILNFFIKPFETITPPTHSVSATQKLWKL